MKVLELFSGTKSVSNVALELGHEVFTSDVLPLFDTHYTVDVRDFDISKLPWTPDVIWASPPCQGFSVAAIGRNWGGGIRGYEPKSDSARLSIELALKTIHLIDTLKPRYWFIENPRGLLRKMPFMEDLLKRHGGVRHTVTYCQYGDKRMKPTDIWTNNLSWTPRAVCKNGSPCHEAAPRGAKTGTQGLKGDIERSRIPVELCREIINSMKSNG